MWIGIDAGGTFTDVVGFEPKSNALFVLKRPSTPKAPAEAILDGIRELLQIADARADVVEHIHHGTTIATNALLQQRLARTGMLTTKGFRDVLDIARQRRPHLFDLSVEKPHPVALRETRVEVDERLDERGQVERAMSDDDVRGALSILREEACDAVAICFLHAYANPEHEQRAKALIEREWPDVAVCTSFDVLSEMREYERFASTVVNAGLMPVMNEYLHALGEGIRTIGILREPRIMQSNGGTVNTAVARARPVTTFVSGPAAGVIAAECLGERIAQQDLMTIDMGGTSTDVCLVTKGVAALENERVIAGLPLRARALAIHTVGAGGGSIGWVDAGGLLKVGPQSAGADPGPAAYGRGGHTATVTDANLVLGRLGADVPLAGHLAPSLDAAEAALGRLGQSLGLSAEAAAAGMLRVVHTNMCGALRVVSVERGHDPRAFTLVPFGGAGPLHAAELAAELGMQRIVVPPRPGLNSALGLLQADARSDFSQTIAVELSRADAPYRLGSGLRALLLRAHEWVTDEGYAPTRARFETFVDMRYVGQSFELSVPVIDADALDIDALTDAFHVAHEALNGYASADHATEAMTLRLTARIPNGNATRIVAATAQAPVSSAGTASRNVWFEHTGFVETPVRARSSIQTGAQLSGPALITQMDATTLVPPDFNATADTFGNLVIERS
tara:strand:+ start:385 stop:2424 length:2040 start_codon:yes stop_codon:yes gene_type:complete